VYASGIDASALYFTLAFSMRADYEDESLKAPVNVYLLLLFMFSVSSSAQFMLIFLFA
jgi:hypothetical protein